MEKERKATLSAIIEQPNGTYEVLQVFNEETVITKGTWKDRRTGKERSITVPTGVHNIKKRFNLIPTYGKALMVAEAIANHNFKFLKGLT